jgi:hypothetical protein
LSTGAAILAVFFGLLMSSGAAGSGSSEDDSDAVESDRRRVKRAVKAAKRAQKAAGLAGKAAKKAGSRRAQSRPPHTVALAKELEEARTGFQGCFLDKAAGPEKAIGKCESLLEILSGTALRHMRMDGEVPAPLNADPDLALRRTLNTSLPEPRTGVDLIRLPVELLTDQMDLHLDALSELPMTKRVLRHSSKEELCGTLENLLEVFEVQRCSVTTPAYDRLSSLTWDMYEHCEVKTENVAIMGSLWLENTIPAALLSGTTRRVKSKLSKSGKRSGKSGKRSGKSGKRSGKSGKRSGKSGKRSAGPSLASVQSRRCSRHDIQDEEYLALIRRMKTLIFMRYTGLAGIFSCGGISLSDDVAPSILERRKRSAAMCESRQRIAKAVGLLHRFMVDRVMVDALREEAVRTQGQSPFCRHIIKQKGSSGSCVRELDKAMGWRDMLEKVPSKERGVGHPWVGEWAYTYNFKMDWYLTNDVDIYDMGTKGGDQVYLGWYTFTDYPDPPKTILCRGVPRRTRDVSYLKMRAVDSKDECPTLKIDGSGYFLDGSKIDEP